MSSKSLPRLLRRLLLGAGATYLLLVVAITLGQRALLYPRPPFAGLPVEGSLWYADFPGGRVPVWLRRNPAEPDAPLVVWMHGNAEQLASASWVVDEFLDRGLSFAALEYPGYGAATGVGPTEETLFAAVRASLATLTPTGLPVVCVGASLGTGPAAMLASEGHCDRLVLAAPYTRLPEAAQAVYPFLPGRWLVWDQLATIERAPDIRVPTLVVHGEQDRICPVWMGRAIANAIPDATLLEVPRGHNDLFDAAVFDAIAAFARAGDTQGALAH
jgi:alpha-beta hydrolase superfamily lysophospholipase